jgi:5-methylcytosine-specific restriction enzyme subunit McrC
MVLQLTEHETSAEPLPPGTDVDGLLAYLDEVWQSRLNSDELLTEETSRTQGFLEVLRGDRIRAKRYVGFIQWQGLTIEIYPKLFPPDHRNRALPHLVWWLAYSRRVRFPFSDFRSDSHAVDCFPEALIAHFARTTGRLLENQPYHRYEERTEALTYVRGRLDVPTYVRDHLGTGRWHEVTCQYEPFVHDNRLNQIIKFVARRQLHQTRFDETRQELERILFMLDEVTDRPATVADCDAVELNRFFESYADVLAMCRFFLAHQFLNLQHDDQRHFCFLVPMETVFEDFVSGFLETHFSERFQIQSQATGWLTKERVFQIRNDVLLTERATGRVLVIDTKYKIRRPEPGDRKAGIDQSDLYQMIAYALRRGTDRVLLLYPATEGVGVPEAAFTVESTWLGSTQLRISALELTITAPSQADLDARMRAQLTHLLDLLIKS